MKALIVAISLLLLSTNTWAKGSYNNNRKGHYVTVSHLHKIFKNVKRKSKVSQKALAQAFTYYRKNRYRKHLSPDYIGIADYTKISSDKRLYIINLHNGIVYSYSVAHGKKSGAKGGRVWRSSNVLGSNMTPYGFYKVGSYEGRTTTMRHPYLSVKGLEWTNKKVGLPTRKGGRDILLHTANYVNKDGRSLGCFAIKPQDKYRVFSKLKRALLYSYTGR